MMTKNLLHQVAIRTSQLQPSKIC